MNAKEQHIRDIIERALADPNIQPDEREFALATLPTVFSEFHSFLETHHHTNPELCLNVAKTFLGSTATTMMSGIQGRANKQIFIQLVVDHIFQQLVEALNEDPNNFGNVKITLRK